MPVIRAFIAIDLSKEIQVCLELVSNQVKERLEDVPVRWVPTENIHLTLKFLGNVSESNLEILKKMLASVVSSHKVFEISAGGLGAFPKIHRPRVIWIGLEAPPELEAIQHAIEQETARLGYAKEERPFSPHLTLARVSRNASSADIHKISKVLKTEKVGFLGVTRVREVHLYRSDLKPSGAIYTRLFTAALGEGL
jgi:2'-5' RNA ligase